MSFDLKKFGVFLKTLREDTMYKQKEVADAIDITVQTYGKYENGLREPNISILYKLASFFKVSPILFLIGDYPLKDHEYAENEFMILSIMSSNYEKYKWLCERYKDKNVYTNIGSWDEGAKYIKKEKQNLLKIKSSLFRMHGNLVALKSKMLKEIDKIEDETIKLIEELDDTI